MYNMRVYRSSWKRDTGTVDPRALVVFIHNNTLRVVTTFDVSWLANSKNFD